MLRFISEVYLALCLLFVAMLAASFFFSAML